MTKFVLVTKRRTPQNATWEYRPVLRRPRYVSRKKDPVVCVLMESLLIRNENVWAIFSWVLNVFAFALVWNHCSKRLTSKTRAVRSKRQKQSWRARTRVFPRFGFSLSFVICQSVSALVSTHLVDYLTKNNVHLKPFSFFLMVLFSSVHWEYF